MPPKSYADAAEEGMIDEDSIKESPPHHERSMSEPRALGEILDEEEQNIIQPVTPTPSQRRSKFSGETYSDAVSMGLNGTSHSRLGLDGEAEELSGQGRDESPRSPMRRAQRRSSSSKGLNNGRAKEVDEPMEGNKLVYEKFQNGDGEALTSVKPAEDYELALRQDEVEASHQRKNELASGKRAGAGWESSP